MKDIYSPLDIDEAWDDMAPVSAAGPAMANASATSVAIKDDSSDYMSNSTVGTSMANDTTSTTSTLPPASTNMDADSSEDAAYDFAGVNTNDGKLNYNEISPTATENSAEMASTVTIPGAMTSEAEAPKADLSGDSVKAEEASQMDEEKPTATPIPVIDMNEASKANEPAGVQAGESFAPVETPAEDRFESLKTSETTSTEEPMPASSEDASVKPATMPDLPVSPAESKTEDTKKEESEAPSKAEMKFDSGETMTTSADDAEKHLEKVKATASAQSEELAKIISSLESKRDGLEEVINDKTSEKQGVEKQIEDAKSQKEKIDQIVSM